MSENKKSVLIVDDSAFIRSLLTRILGRDSRLQVVGAAADPFEARERIKQLNPDVITLDIEMPKMNGITFLKNLMRLRPMPVVMISTLTQEGAPQTLEALELGAVDFVSKPDATTGLELYADVITEKVYTAATARVREAKPEGEADTSSLALSRPVKQDFFIALGASTGGTEALKEVICNMPAGSPPIVVVQHIPKAFSSSYAKRVNKAAAMQVVEAEDDMPVEPGSVYIAPGDRHLVLARNAAGIRCRLDDGPPVNRHRPAVDVTFDSVLEVSRGRCLGAILTGMGADGAQGLLKMREAGCMTFAQDEETSVVWGMPGMAVRLGAAQKVLPLTDIARHIVMSVYA